VAREGEPAPRIASLWALSGVASLAGATLATLALRVVGATDTLGLAAGAYLAVAAVAWSPALTGAAATTPR
jgi:hypothetical protein